MIAPVSDAVHGFQQLTRPGSGNTRLNLPTTPNRSTSSARALNQKLSNKKKRLSSDSKLHIHVDYLRLIGKSINEEAFNDLFLSVSNNAEFAHYSDGSYSLGKGCPNYDNMAINAHHVKVLYNTFKDTETGELFYDYILDITGATLERWDTVKVWRLCLQLSHERYNGKWSRFDIAIDDYDKSTNLIPHCMDAIKNEQNTGFRKWRYWLDGEGKDVIGETLYLGTRESKRLVRIYDAEGKHGINAVRFEAELRGKYSKQAVKEFINEGLSKRGCMDAINSLNDDELNQHLSTWLGKVAIGHIAFKDKSNQRINGEVSSLDNLKFWDDFVKRIGGIHKILVPKVTTTVQKTKEWFLRQVSRPLARIKVAMGVKPFKLFLEDALAEGFARLDRFDELLIDDYRTPHPAIS